MACVFVLVLLVICAYAQVNPPTLQALTPKQPTLEQSRLLARINTALENPSIQRIVLGSKPLTSTLADAVLGGNSTGSDLKCRAKYIHPLKFSAVKNNASGIFTIAARCVSSMASTANVTLNGYATLNLAIDPHTPWFTTLRINITSTSVNENLVAIHSPSFNERITSAHQLLTNDMITRAFSDQILGTQELLDMQGFITDTSKEALGFDKGMVAGIGGTIISSRRWSSSEVLNPYIFGDEDGGSEFSGSQSNIPPSVTSIGPTMAQSSANCFGDQDGARAGGADSSGSSSSSSSLSNANSFPFLSGLSSSVSGGGA